MTYPPEHPLARRYAREIITAAPGLVNGYGVIAHLNTTGQAKPDGPLASFTDTEFRELCTSILVNLAEARVTASFPTDEPTVNALVGTAIENLYTGGHAQQATAVQDLADEAVWLAADHSRLSLLAETLLARTSQLTAELTATADRAPDTWTDPDGTAYDLTRDMIDRDGDRWVYTHTDSVPFAALASRGIPAPDRSNAHPISDVIARFGPLAPALTEPERDARHEAVADIQDISLGAAAIHAGSRVEVLVPPRGRETITNASLYKGSGGIVTSPDAGTPTEAWFVRLDRPKLPEWAGKEVSFRASELRVVAADAGNEA